MILRIFPWFAVIFVLNNCLRIIKKLYQIIFCVLVQKFHRSETQVSSQWKKSFTAVKLLYLRSGKNIAAPSPFGNGAAATILLCERILPKVAPRRGFFRVVVKLLCLSHARAVVTAEGEGVVATDIGARHRQEYRLPRCGVCYFLFHRIRTF